MISVSYPILGGNLAEVGSASRLLKEQLKRLGVHPEAMRRVMIAAYEAEANVVIHATRGALYARLGDGRIDMEIVDQGPGIPDVPRAMTDGYSTASEEARKLGFGAGMGLPNIKKSSDSFSIQSSVGKGTRVLSTIVFRAAELPSRETPDCSPRLRPELCRRCLACVRACPTEAIRLFDTGPTVLAHLCIGCTACIASCRHGVFVVDDGTAAVAGSAPAGAAIVGSVALLAASRGPEELLSSLGSCGFAELRLLEEWDDALLQEALREAGAGARPLPLIPPLCPAVVNLVETAFPSLIPHLVPCLSPMEAASSELGPEPLVAVVSCPAQAALAGAASGRVSVCSPAAVASLRGEGAAAVVRGGASVFRRREGGVRIDGVRRVLAALAAAERGLLGDIPLLELRACEGGCAGSPLLASDPSVALARLARAGIAGCETGERERGEGEGRLVAKTEPYTPRRGVRLDEDMGRAMEKLRRIGEAERALPGRDCAVCGSPSCASFAEDLVLGRRSTPCPIAPTGGSA